MPKHRRVRRPRTASNDGGTNARGNDDDAGHGGSGTGKVQGGLFFSNEVLALSQQTCPIVISRALLTNRKLAMPTEGQRHAPAQLGSEHVSRTALQVLNVRVAVRGEHGRQARISMRDSQHEAGMEGGRPGDIVLDEELVAHPDALKSHAEQAVAAQQSR